MLFIPFVISIYTMFGLYMIYLAVTPTIYEHYGLTKKEVEELEKELEENTLKDI